MSNNVKNEKTVEQRRAENRAEYEMYLNERVPVTIPLDGSPVGTTTTVSCQGVVYEIELGKTVMVPRKVAEIIQRSIDGNMEVERKMQEVSRQATELGAY